MGDGSLSAVQCLSFIDLMRRLAPADYLAAAGGGGECLNQLKAVIDGETMHKKADGSVKLRGIWTEQDKLNLTRTLMVGRL